MARPMSGKYIQEDMCKKINSYTDACIAKKEVPILKEVVVKAGWNYDYVMGLERKEGWEDLKESIARLVNTKEWMLERLALKGKVEKTMAVFSLKQLGWKDQQVVDLGENATQALKVKLVVAE